MLMEGIEALRIVELLRGISEEDRVTIERDAHLVEIGGLAGTSRLGECGNKVGVEGNLVGPGIDDLSPDVDVYQYFTGLHAGNHIALVHRQAPCSGCAKQQRGYRSHAFTTFSLPRDIPEQALRVSTTSWLLSTIHW